MFQNDQYLNVVYHERQYIQICALLTIEVATSVKLWNGDKKIG